MLLLVEILRVSSWLLGLNVNLLEDVTILYTQVLGVFEPYYTGGSGGILLE